MLVPAFFAAFVSWPSCLEVDSPVAAALLAASMVYAALSRVFHGLAAMPTYAALSGVTWRMVRCCYGLRFQMAMVEMLAVTGTLWSEALPLLYEWCGPAAAMLRPVGRGENIRFLVLFEMVQCGSGRARAPALRV